MNWYKQAQNIQDISMMYPLIQGNTINGLLVKDDIPNFGSINATFNDYEILPGIRQVLISDFEINNNFFYAANDKERARELMKDIRLNKEINPLIVAIDEEGPYILEGAHRLYALAKIGLTLFPALVVIDIENINKK